MKTVEVIVEHAGKNLSAYIEGAPVITVGNDMKEIEDNMKEAIELYLEDNPNPCEVLSGEFELKFKIDAATFINYYSSIFTKAALSRITGINERQLWHYAAGVHKPRRRQLEKIQKGIQSLSRELSAIMQKLRIFFIFNSYLFKNKQVSCFSGAKIRKKNKILKTTINL